MITVVNKLDLYQYVDMFVEDEILKTFNTLWDQRNYWKYEPLAYIEDNQIKGFIAYTINEKYPGKLKVYYLHVKKESRGQGIAKQLLMYVSQVAINNDVDLLYVTEENTDGSKLFKDIEFITKVNEFGTIDKIYDISKLILSDMFIK